MALSSDRLHSLAAFQEDQPGSRPTRLDRQTYRLTRDKKAWRMQVRGEACFLQDHNHPQLSTLFREDVGEKNNQPVGVAGSPCPPTVPQNERASARPTWEMAPPCPFLFFLVIYRNRGVGGRGAEHTCHHHSLLLPTPTPSWWENLRPSVVRGLTEHRLTEKPSVSALVSRESVGTPR